MTLRLGMLGMWHSHTDGIVRQVLAHPDEFALVAFWDSEPDVVANRAKTWGKSVPGYRVLSKPEDVLSEKLDGVIVESRVHWNLKLARMALESGRPVMLEKPAGDNWTEYRQLIDLAQRKHLHVQMIYLFRYMSAVEEMLKRARAGELGRIYEFRARLTKELASYQRFAEELRTYRGGMFFELAGHLIDMMIAILGKPKQITPFLAHHHTAPPGNYMDNGVGVFGYDNAFGIIEVPALEVVPFQRRIEVYGTEGACIIPHMGSGHLANKNIQPLEVFRVGEKGWKQLDLPAQTLQIKDLREFAAVISGKKQADYSMEHDLSVQEALLRSSNMMS